EGLERFLAIVVWDGECGVVTESLVGDAVGDEDGHFIGLHSGELDDGANLRIHEIEQHVAKEMGGIHLEQSASLGSDFDVDSGEDFGFRPKDMPLPFTVQLLKEGGA